MIAGTEKKLGADINRSFFVRRSNEGSIPVEAQLFLVISLGLNQPSFEGMAIDPAGEAALIFGIEIVRISWIDKGVKAVAIENVFPLRVGDAAGIFRLSNPAAIIL